MKISLQTCQAIAGTMMSDDAYVENEDDSEVQLRTRNNTRPNSETQATGRRDESGSEDRTGSSQDPIDLYSPSDREDRDGIQETPHRPSILRKETQFGPNFRTSQREGRMSYPHYEMRVREGRDEENSTPPISRRSKSPEMYRGAHSYGDAEMHFEERRAYLEKARRDLTNEIRGLQLENACDLSFEDENRQGAKRDKSYDRGFPGAWSPRIGLKGRFQGEPMQNTRTYIEPHRSFPLNRGQSYYDGVNDMGEGTYMPRNTARDRFREPQFPRDCDYSRPNRFSDKPNRRAPDYDGSTPWDEFSIQFEIIAEMNGWSERRKSAELAASLRGKALSVLSVLNYNERQDFQALTQALASRFDSGDQMEVHKANLRTRVRRKNETFAELGQDLKRLVRKAYPRASEAVRDDIALNAFMEGLADPDLEWAIYQRKPQTTDEAVIEASRMEAFKLSRTRTRRDIFSVQENKSGTEKKEMIVGASASAPVPVLREAQPLKPFIPNQGSNGFEFQQGCFNCGRPGHIKKYCRYPPQFQGPLPCAYCQGTGHQVSYCKARTSDMNQARNWAQQGNC